MTSCQICGFSENPDDSIYCTECGGKVAEESQPAAPEPAAPEPAAPEPAAPEPAAPEPAAPEPAAPEPAAQITGTVLVLPDNSNIQVESSPKTIGRIELLDYLKTLQDVDPMTISRQHFTILEDKGTYYVEDGKTVVQDKPSANHTYLNGVDITDKGQQELKNDDVIDLANTVNLTFRI